MYDRNGSDLNLWREEIFEIEAVDEQFQLVIEATAGYTDMADIAIDDVALLDDTDCTNDRSFTTSAPTEETGGAFNIQTCVDRCDEVKKSTANDTETIESGPGKGGLFLHCDCYDGCEDTSTCCPDYRRVCVFREFFF